MNSVYPPRNVSLSVLISYGRHLIRKVKLVADDFGEKLQVIELRSCVRLVPSKVRNEAFFVSYSTPNAPKDESQAA